MAGLDGGTFTKADNDAGGLASLAADFKPDKGTKGKKAPAAPAAPAEISLVPAQQAQTSCARGADGRLPVGCSASGASGGRSHIWGTGVRAGDPAQVATPANGGTGADWLHNVVNDPQHQADMAAREAQAQHDKVAATNSNLAHAYIDDTGGHAVQAGTEEAQLLNKSGMAPQAGRLGNGVLGGLAGAVMRGFVAPSLVTLATRVEHETASHPDSWTYRTAHNYVVKFDKQTNLERQLHEGLDPKEAIAKSKQKPGESKADYEARLKEEAKMVGDRGVRPAKVDLMDQVEALRDRAAAREGVDLTNPDAVRVNDLKAKFLDRYLKTPPGEHAKTLEDFVRKNPINAAGGLTEDDAKLLQQMSVAVDKDAQLVSKLTKATESLPIRVLTGLTKGAAFVLGVDTVNYYADVFAHHEGAKMGSHPGITTAMGWVAPQALYYGGIMKSAAEDATKWDKAKNVGKRMGVAGLFSIGGAIGLNIIDNAFPSLRHSQYSRIMNPTSGESIAEGATWVMPVAEEKTRAKMAVGTWLLGRSTNLTTPEALGTAAVAIPATWGLGKLLGKQPGKVMLAEAGILAGGRILNWLGFAGNDRTGTNDDAWAAVKKDTDQMTESSLRKAVTAMTDLGHASPDALMIYRKQIITSRDKDNQIVFPIAPTDVNDPKVDYGKLISNDRTALVLAEAEGQTILDSGLTQAGIKNIYPAYTSHGIFDGTFDFKPVIAPGQQADLTGQAFKDMLFASDMTAITEENLKAAQKQQQSGQSTMNGHTVTDADIQQMEDEKKKLDTMMRSMLRDGPDAKPHDVREIVEGHYAFWNKSSYSLEDFAQHDQHSYDHILDALEGSPAQAGKIQQAIPWLANQEKLGLNPELSKKYVAKLCRDAAMMHMGEALYQFNHGDVTAAKITIDGSARSSDPYAWRNANSMIALAQQFDPDNVDLQAIIKEKNDIAARIKSGDDGWYNNVKNPLHIPKPPFVP